MLIRTNQLRDNAQKYFDEGIAETQKILDAASKLLFWQADQINNGKNVTHFLSWALSEILDEQVKEIGKLDVRAKYLATPPDVVIPPATAQFHPADANKETQR